MKSVVRTSGLSASVLFLKAEFDAIGEHVVVIYGRNIF